MNAAWIGILGALLGAAVGGGIAHLNAWRFATRQEKRERLGLAFSVVFKVQRAMETLRQARNHVQDGMNQAAQNNWPLWQGLMPFFGTDNSERLQFNPSELALFAQMNDAEFANKLQELSTVHNLTADLLREYRARRERFSEGAAKYGKVMVEGPVASFESAEPGMFLQALELEQYAQSLASITGDGALHALDCAGAVCGKLKAFLNDDRFKIELRIVEPAQGLGGKAE